MERRVNEKVGISSRGGNQENPSQSVKCFLLADAQFPTDESDDPETGKQRSWQINRIAKSIFNLTKT